MGFFDKLFGGKREKPTRAGTMLDEDKYWTIINESLQNSNDPESQKNFLVTCLQELSFGEIIGFKLRTEKLLHDSYNSDLWCAGYILNGGCSDDGFEYFRRWIISRGKEVFYNSLTNPDSLVSEISDDIEDYYFEDLLSVADDAFEKRSSEDIYDYIDEPAFEKIVGRYPTLTFKWEEEDHASMKAICPGIFEKAWKWG